MHFVIIMETVMRQACCTFYGAHIDFVFLENCSLSYDLIEVYEHFWDVRKTPLVLMVRNKTRFLPVWLSLLPFF